MQDLNDLAYFVKVVDHHGFAPAARALGMQKSKLSRRIAGLEERLGVRLIQRSTRHFSVTEIGHIYYQHCQAMLVEAEAAQQAIDQATAEPLGLIRMACPPGLLAHRMGEAVAKFLIAFPKVEIRLKAFNRPVDVIQEGFDLVICAEAPKLDAASLAMRKLGAIEQVIVAIPELIRPNSPILMLADLRAYSAIAINSLPTIADGNELEWRLMHADGAVASVSLSTRFVTDDLSALRAAVLAGIGIGLAPKPLVEDDLRAGRLVELLPEWKPANIPAYAIFPSRRSLLPSMRALLDHLADECEPYRTGV